MAGPERASALIVANPKGEILILDEHRQKLRLGKPKGSSSIPMETLEPGETFRAALYRMFKPGEELPGMTVEGLEDKHAGTYQVVPGVWVRLYTAKARSFMLPAEVHGGEVGNYRWMLPTQALTLYLRQGAFEMIDDYSAGRCILVCREKCRLVGLRQ